MKISKKEKTMLLALATVGLGIVYYQFIYKVQIEKVQQLAVRKEQLQEEYDGVLQTIRTLEERKGKIKIYNSNIKEKSKIYYPQIIQEKVILEVDKLITDSGLKGNVSFTPVTVGQVEVVNVAETSKGNSSLQAIVDEYNLQFKDEQSESTTTNQNTTESTSNAPVVSSGTTIEQLKVNMNFTAPYQSVKKFLDLVDSGERKLAVSNISLSASNGNDVSGTLTLEFYGIPKLFDYDKEYLEWTLNNTYGKDTPFSSGNATGTTIESFVEQKEQYDFIMSLKSSNSDLPTVMLGKANDKDNLSYVYADNKGTEVVEIVLTQVNNVYYYKYKTSFGTYPLVYAGNGEIFTPVKDDITLEIMVQGRVDTSDLAGAQLIIINDTDKVVNVNINGDDANKPRVTVESQGNSVKVTNK